MGNDVAHCDYETRSRADIRKHGAEKYARNPSTEILMMGWAIGADPVQVWVPKREPFPALLRAHIERGGKIAAYNAHFEWWNWDEQRKREPDVWPVLLWEQMIDTMAIARAAGFPAALADTAVAMGLPIEKDSRGRTLIQLLSVPMKNGEFREDEALFREFMAYCAKDVEVEREVHKRLPALSEFEQQLWVLDAKINERGVGLDLASARLAMEIVDAEAEKLSERVKAATGGSIDSAKQVGAMRLFLLSEGVDLPKLNNDTVTRALAKTIHSDLARELLTLRKLAAKSSTGKLKAMLTSSIVHGNGEFGRAHGLFAYWGADTGRWAGRRIQAQNFPRSPEGFDGDDVIEALHRPSARDYLEAWYGSPMDALSWALRSLICAAPGKKLIACDYSNIEGRVLAWLAGETWKLDAFRAYDAGTGPDLYKLSYARAFGIEINEVTKTNRLIGKVMELALGYQGGKGAFASMAANYGITVIADDAPRPETGGEILTESEVENIKLGWRAAHEQTVALWRRLNECATNAVVDYVRIENDFNSKCATLKARLAANEITQARHDELVKEARASKPPTKVFDAGCVSYRVQNHMLYCKLPSGRMLSYPYPSLGKIASYSWRSHCESLATDIIESDPRPDASTIESAKTLIALASRGSETNVVSVLKKLTTLANTWGETARNLVSTLPDNMVPQVKLYGRDKKYYDEYGKPKKARWGQWSAYGGLFCENICQAVARDILAHAMPRVEAEGYSITMHVHDELVAEVDENFGSPEALAEIMCVLPKWAHGLPIAAEGWEGKRYRK